MCLLKNNVPFVWGDQDQRSLDALKKALIPTPLLSLPNYNQKYILYHISFESTIGMIFIKEYDGGKNM